MIILADQHNIYVCLYPISELTFPAGNISAISDAAAQNYGAFLGNRYKDYTNIIWCFGNDNLNIRVESKIAAGINSARSNNLMTTSVYSGANGDATSPWVQKHNNGCTFINYDAWYTYGGAAYACLAEYNRTNPMPTFIMESWYEFPTTNGNFGNATVDEIRRQYWSTLLCGGSGGIVGGMWQFASGWSGQLNSSPGLNCFLHFTNLLSTRQWWTLVPDQTHAFVTSGYGTLANNRGCDYASAGLNAAGTLGLVYVPSSRSITVAMAKMAGSTTARWYDPSNGSFSAIAGSPFVNSGSKPLSTPGNTSDGKGDWVLVLEAGSSTPALFDYGPRYHVGSSGGGKMVVISRHVARSAMKAELFDVRGQKMRHDRIRFDENPDAVLSKQRD
jgi:hypothetical protein